MCSFILFSRISHKRRGWLVLFTAGFPPFPLVSSTDSKKKTPDPNPGSRKILQHLQPTKPKPSFIGTVNRKDITTRFLTLRWKLLFFLFLRQTFAWSTPGGKHSMLWKERVGGENPNFPSCFSLHSIFFFPLVVVAHVGSWSKWLTKPDVDVQLPGNPEQTIEINLIYFSSFNFFLFSFFFLFQSIITYLSVISVRKSKRRHSKMPSLLLGIYRKYSMP